MTRSGRSWWRAGLAAMALAGLAGCTSLPEPDETLALAASGRLAVRVDAPEGVRSTTAVFELLGRADRGELRLASPLGTVLAVARWQPGQAWVRTQGQRQDYASLDDLTRELMGESLPVHALFDWLRARPWPGASSRPREGGPGFVQMGWTVELDTADQGLIVVRRNAPVPVTVRARVDS
ncbi:MAG: lipoprotein insertase outer membrane protein LolB [Caldimonas sp.]|uniref:lipoprotein insertase outer membrane protein LolB n=1 Tax=Caldimonas sp. TaxID=2838790 RepID=UPI003919416B